MFRVSATGTNTSTQACLPLVNCVINQRLLQATHAVDSVAAHRCHELWSNKYVAEWQTIAPDMWPLNSPDLSPVDYAIWSVIQLDAAGNNLRVYYNSMNCDVSFLLGSASTLFRWGGHLLSCMCNTFLPAYNSPKIILRRSMAIANGTCVSFCNQPEAKFGYLTRVTPVCRCLHWFCGWKHLATSRELKAHFGLPWVCPWDNRGSRMDEKRIQCLSNTSQHVPIYLKPFPSNSTSKFKSSPF